MSFISKELFSKVSIISTANSILLSHQVNNAALIAHNSSSKCLHISPISRAGHNRWSKIGRKKAVVDLEKSKVIHKYRNQIASIIRAGGGSDPDTNIRLASAIDRAKDAGLSKSSIEGAVAHATSKHAVGEAVIYEGRSESGYMLIMEVMTDNKKRTRPILRKFLMDHGCVMGEAGSSLFNFEHKGIVRVPRHELQAKSTEPLDLAIEVGAEDVIADQNTWGESSDAAPEVDGSDLESKQEEPKLQVSDDSNDLESSASNDDCFQFKCEPRDLKAVSDIIKAQSFTVASATLEYLPKTVVELNQKKYERALRVIGLLSEEDGVMEVYDNFVLKKE